MDEQKRGVRARTLARAAEIVGGTEPLRRRLNVSAWLLAIWISGAQPPPTEVFLEAVDIVEEEVIACLKTRRDNDVAR
jgi:hypothetical protein